MIRSVDKHQAAIVDVLRSVGASVTLLHEVGKGCPDLLVGFRGKNYLFEIKSEKGTLTPRQELWFETWRGHATVIRTIDEALHLLMQDDALALVLDSDEYREVLGVTCDQ